MKKKIISSVIAAAVAAASLFGAAFKPLSAGAAENAGVLVITDDVSSDVKSDVSAFDNTLKSYSQYTLCLENNVGTAGILKKVKQDADYQAKIKSANYVFLSIGIEDVIEPVFDVIGKGKYKNLREAITNVSEAEASKIDIQADVISDNIVDTAKEIRKLNPKAEIIIRNMYNPLSVDVNSSKYSTDEAFKINLANENIEDGDHIEYINKAIDDYAKSNKSVRVADAFKEFGGKAENYTNVDNLDPHVHGDGAKVLADLLVDAAKGDANMDGKITAEDATMVLISYATTLTGGSPITTNFAGDATLDSKVTSEDATAILIYFATQLADPENVPKITTIGK